MQHLISVESVGVLGLGSKLTTFVVRVMISGGTLKSEAGKIHLKNSLDMSYRTYDTGHGESFNRQSIRKIENITSPANIKQLVDEYCSDAFVEDQDGLITKKKITELGVQPPGFENMEDLKKSLILNIHKQYRQYIDEKAIG